MSGAWKEMRYEESGTSEDEWTKSTNGPETTEVILVLKIILLLYEYTFIRG